MIRLGVNIDHVATLRQARGGTEPDPVHAAVEAELGGADQITVHLREDRRHIQDRDLDLLRRIVQTRLNLEMALAPEVLALAVKVRPDQATLVPERRQELTTEGGLNVVKGLDEIARAVPRLKEHGIAVSLFIDPDPAQIRSAAKLGVEAVELHTGAYANARGQEEVDRHVEILFQAATLARNLRLRVYAGHGLNYRNIAAIARIQAVEEVNIGHSIVSRAVLSGLREAVREMKALLIR